MRRRRFPWLVWRFYLTWLASVVLVAAAFIAAGYGLTALAVHRWALS